MMESDQASRSGSPESLASSELGTIDLSDEDEIGLYEDLEQTIAGDLERLTDSGSTVNQLELKHQQAWKEYVKVKDDGLKHLQVLKKKLQSSIEKTEPFVVVWRRARDLQEQAHAAAMRFERAHSEYESAKETLKIAEDGIANLETERRSSPRLTDSEREERAKSPGYQIDEAWQETLTNATERVARTSQTRLECEIEHRRLTVEFQKCQTEFKSMEARLKRSIKKSRPYYEARHKCNQRLIEIKKHIQELDKKLLENKKVYKSTMKHLESLSYLLHDSRERRSQSVSLQAGSSEPNLAVPRPSTPDFPLRMAVTPDVRKKQVISNITFNFKGSAGTLPTVQPSKATASPEVGETRSSPEQRAHNVSIIVSDCLSNALQRVESNERDGEEMNQGGTMEEKEGTDTGISDNTSVGEHGGSSNLSASHVSSTNRDSGISSDVISANSDGNSSIGDPTSSDITTGNEESKRNENIEPTVQKSDCFKESSEATINGGVSDVGVSQQDDTLQKSTDNSNTAIDGTELNLETTTETLPTKYNQELTPPTNYSTTTNSPSQATHTNTTSKMSQSNASSPRVSHSNKNSPAVSRNNTNSPTVSHSNTNSPRVSHSNTNSPGVSHSNTSSPGVSHSNTSSPSVSMKFAITY